MEEVKPKATLLDYNENNIKNIAISAKLTHSKKGLEDLDKDMSNKEKENLVKKMIDLGHESTLEHSYYYFRVVCSRNCSHQLVRQRVGVAYSQRSERYVLNDNVGYIIPPDIEDKREAKIHFDNVLKHSEDVYCKLRSVGIKKEDARFVLPRIATEVAVSYNARSLRHFFDLRSDKKAQWEIREIAKQMLEQVKEVNPAIVYDL